MTAQRNLVSLALLAAFGLTANSCATTARTALERDKARLEREIARLQADKASLDARNAALDDKLLILERRLERCRDSSRPELPVVKLTTSSDVEDRSDSVSGQVEPRANKRRSDEKRPVLTLHGSSSGRNRGSVKSGPVFVGRSEDFQSLSPDDLGVVRGAEMGARTPKDDPMDEFNTAYRLYANKRYGEALDAFATYLREHPDHGYADNALFWRGECYFASGRVLKAIGELERLVARYPRSDKKASALYRVGYAYDKLGDRGRALEYYFKVVDNHPGTDAARRASRRVAVLQEEGISTGAAVPTAAKR